MKTTKQPYSVGPLLLGMGLVMNLLCPLTASAYLVFEFPSGKIAVLSSEGGTVKHQNCGHTELTLSQLEDLALKPQGLTNFCHKASQQPDYSTFETDYVISVQSLFGVPLRYAGIDAVSRLSRRRIEGERTSANGTPPEKIAEKIYAANSEILAHLGSESHRILSKVNDGPLVQLAYDALLPNYYGSDRFWTLSNATTASNLDEACPAGSVIVSIDRILNSPSFLEIVDWLSRQKKTTDIRILTWYRWNEAVKYDEEAIGYVAKEQAFVLTPNQAAVEWKKRAKGVVPATSSRDVTLASLPGMTERERFLYPVATSDKGNYRPLCTRIFSPLEDEEKEGYVEQAQQSLLPIARSFQWTVPALFRKASANETFERLFSKGLSNEEKRDWRFDLSEALGFNLKSVGQASEESINHRAIAQARQELQSIRQTRNAANQRLAEAFENFTATAHRVDTRIDPLNPEYHAARDHIHQVQREIGRSSYDWSVAEGKAQSKVAQLEEEQKSIRAKWEQRTYTRNLGVLSHLNP